MGIESVADTTANSPVTVRLHLAADLACAAFENGASAIAADRAFHSVMNAAGAREPFTVWRLNVLSAGADGDTIVKPVRMPRLNLVRAAAAAKLAEQIRGKPFEPRRLRDDVDRVVTLASPYGPWMQLAATAFTAALFSRNQHGNWAAAGGALAGAAVGQLLRRRLRAGRASASLTTVICAALSAVVTSLALRLRLVDAGPATHLACVMYLIPGVTLINGFYELFSRGYLTIGAQRISYGVWLCALMALGVTFGVSLLR